MQELLQVKICSENARVPSRGSTGAAGYDLYASVGVEIKAGSWGLIETDISIELPSNCYGRIAARSGLAIHHGIMIGAGVIDQDYKGMIKVVLFNWSSKDFNVKIGDRVAQLILEVIQTPRVEVVSSISTSARGGGGFGSTGK